MSDLTPYQQEQLEIGLAKLELRSREGGFQCPQAAIAEGLREIVDYCCKHTLGDGWHYITVEYEEWNEGKSRSYGNTSDGCIHLLAMDLIRSLGRLPAELMALYDTAYPATEPGDHDWLLPENLEKRYRPHTNPVPQWTKQAREALIDDLGDINNHSYVEVLDEFLVGFPVPYMAPEPLQRNPRGVTVAGVVDGAEVTRAVRRRPVACPA